MSKEFPENTYKKPKSKIEKVARIGLAAMALLGAGDFEKAKGDEGSNETGIVAKHRRENFEEGEYNRWLQESSLPDYLRAVERTKRVKAELIRHVGSQEYLNKLNLELDGDIEKATVIQAERLGYLDETKITILNSEDVSIVNAMLDGTIPYVPIFDLSFKDKQEILKNIRVKVDGFYSMRDKEVVLSESVGDDTLVRHELGHVSTHNDKGIPEKTKKVLEDSYQKLGFNSLLDGYLGRPTERLTRKQLVDFEMKEFGIKEYGEEFTDEHYKKLIEYLEEGKFSLNAREFLGTLKRSPEVFKKIFNEIAANESVDFNPVKHA